MFAGKKRTCVVDALNAIPNTAQNPKAAAFVIATNSTPAIPTAVCDNIGSLHFNNDNATKINCNEKLLLEKFVMQTFILQCCQ